MKDVLQPDADQFSGKLLDLQRRLATLRENAAESPETLMLAEALSDLGTTVEELRVAEEEIRQQADELAGAHEVLLAERRRYQDLFEFAPDGYLVTNAEGLIREANSAAGELFKRAPAALPGKPVVLYIAADDLHSFRTNMSLAGKAEAVSVWDTRLKSSDQPGREVECTVAPMRDPGTGHLLELRWRLHDITDRKRAETELQSSREALRGMAGRMEAVREEERARVARAVHDEVGAALTAIKMDLAQLRSGVAQIGAGRGGGEELVIRAETAATLIDQTMQTVRGIALELRPAVLDDFGLVAALDWQLTEFQKRTGLQVGLSVAPGKDQLDPAAATAVFRVFQEVLTNVMRHAEATRVEVRLLQRDQALVLEVRDNGRGFHPEAVTAGMSMGLMTMRERMRLLGGEVKLESAPGQGTRVQVMVPVGRGAAPARGLGVTA